MILEIALGVLLGALLILFARSRGPGAPAFVLTFFPIFCIGFDLLVAGYLAARAYSGRASRPEAASRA